MGHGPRTKGSVKTKSGTHDRRPSSQVVAPEQAARDAALLRPKEDRQVRQALKQGKGRAQRAIDDLHDRESAH